MIEGIKWGFDGIVSLIDLVVSSVEKEARPGGPENIELSSMEYCNTLTIVGTCLKLGGLAKIRGVSLEFACWTLSIGATCYKFNHHGSMRACIFMAAAS